MTAEPSCVNDILAPKPSYQGADLVPNTEADKVLCENQRCSVVLHPIICKSF